MCRPDPFEPGEFKALFGTRQMAWGDIVPLGYFATWACDPNPTMAELLDMVKRAERLLPQADGGVES